MPLTVSCDDIYDLQIRSMAKRAFREVLAAVPLDQDWKATIVASVSRDYYCATVSGPSGTREKTFFVSERELPRIVDEWLRLYPLR